jgi:hypothetical protein
MPIVLICLMLVYAGLCLYGTIRKKMPGIIH